MSLYRTRPGLWDLATYIRGQEEPAEGHLEIELINPSSVSIIQSDSPCLSEPSNSSNAPLLLILSPSSKYIAEANPRHKASGEDEGVANLII
jgi:hypothetical protein